MLCCDDRIVTFPGPGLASYTLLSLTNPFPSRAERQLSDDDGCQAGMSGRLAASLVTCSCGMRAPAEPPQRREDPQFGPARKANPSAVLCETRRI
jgi:hypothetical protein